MKYIDSDYMRRILKRLVERLERLGAKRETAAIKSTIKFLKVLERFHSVEVVRCKDCKHRDELTKECAHPKAVGWDVIVPEDKDFCSYGERRTDD